VAAEAEEEAIRREMEIYADRFNGNQAVKAKRGQAASSPDRQSSPEHRPENLKNRPMNGYSGAEISHRVQLYSLQRPSRETVSLEENGTFSTH
jgi:hypothetical protein